MHTVSPLNASHDIMFNSCFVFFSHLDENILLKKFTSGQNTVSALGRFVLIIWLFVVLIINSSYTASLTSILTVQQLATGITGLDNLVASALPIGYPAGKFVRNYLIDELNIPESRLVPLSTIEEYANALNRGPKDGGVAAVVDEMPCVEIFLSTHCNFRIVGQEFMKEGWGFVCLASVKSLYTFISVLWTSYK